jgi:hypothetical protein
VVTTLHVAAWPRGKSACSGDEHGGSPDTSWNVEASIPCALTRAADTRQAVIW